MKEWKTHDTQLVGLRRLTYVLGLIGVIMMGGVVSAEEVIPPFVIEGTISNPVYERYTRAVKRVREADFWFCYSNDWWQVEITYPDAETNTPAVQNCMKIPGGVRDYTLFKGSTNDGLRMAIACPTSFPSPGRHDLFATWISFCPHPKLPIIEGNRMRRFLNLPSCNIELFNDTRNEGTYGVKYLEPEKIFLSELNITNNGYYMELMEEVRRHPAPLDNGFWEFQHEVLSTTNINGLKFPLKTVLKLGGIVTFGKTSLFTCREITVKRISFSASDIQRRQAPAALYAVDYRLENFVKGDYNGYIVSNDKWKPVPPPELPVKWFYITNTTAFYASLEAGNGTRSYQGSTNANVDLTLKFTKMKRDELETVVRNFFINAGVGLDSVNPENVGKSVTFYPDTKMLKVRATKGEINIVGKMLEMVEQQGK